MFLFSISVQSQAVLNSGTRSSVVKAGMRGPGGGVGPAENVAQDGVAQDEADDDADTENKMSDDEEEMDTDGDDVHFGWFCPQSVSHVQVHSSVDFISTKIYFRMMMTGTLEGMSKLWIVLLHCRMLSRRI